MKKSSFYDICLSIVKYMFVIVMAIIVITCIFFSNTIYNCDNGNHLFLNGNYPILFLLIGLLLVGIITFLLMKKEKEITLKNMVVLSCIFFVIQVFLIYNYLFETGWDCSQLMATARGLALGEDISALTSWYFLRFPNNLFLVFVMKSIYSLGFSIGLESGLCYALTVVILCFVSNIAGVLLYKILYKLTGNSWCGLVGWILFILLVGLSPWMQVPYSDTFGLIFPIGILSLYYLFPQNKKIIQYLLIGICTIVAYEIKPQACIISIAIALIDLILLIKKEGISSSSKLKNHFKQYIAFIVGCCIAFLMCSACINSLGIKTDKNKEFGITHFLMMGLNNETNGTYSDEDVGISHSASTYEERVKINLETSKQRIEKYGFTGMVDHLHKKLLVVYNDGTFAWGCEGNFYSYKLDTENKPLANILRSFYYTDEEGTNTTYFYSTEQSIWYALLFLMLFAFRIHDKNAEFISIIMLDVIGLTLFELLFEARARYLFCNVPLYIMLATYGLNNIIQTIQNKRNSIQS